MAKKTKVSKKAKIVKHINATVAIIVIILAFPAFFYVYFLDRVYPNVYLAGVNLSGKSENEALDAIRQKMTSQDKIVLNYQNLTFEIPIASINPTYDYDKSVKRAIQLGRSGNTIVDIEQISKSLLRKTSYGLEFSLDEKSLDTQIARISGEISTKPTSPTFTITGNQISITPGKPGTEIDSSNLKLNIERQLADENFSTIVINQMESPSVSANFIENLINEVSNKFNKDPQNAQFTIIDNKVQSFLPEAPGTKVDTQKLRREIGLIQENGINSPPVTLDIPISTVEAQVKTSDVNNLGIKELIGTGTSHFAGSIGSRIFNINLAASRINNALIAPGDTFSFDSVVGDISALNGYQQAYVIENGQTVLGDGGGVCQVSTTIFRAAMNSGLPIMERHAHAYRVHYYEEDAPPGMDATIYSPTVDFKFKNDTANYILIQTQIDLRNLILTFNLYGTKDGRTADITKPTLWGYQSAPADLYTNDPTLPLGTIKQIDFAASGIKSQFDYTVTKNGQVTNHQTFYSNFEPWQAKFLRGTKT